MRPIRELKIRKYEGRCWIEGLTSPGPVMEREDAEAVLLALKAHAALRASGVEFADTEVPS